MNKKCYILLLTFFAFTFWGCEELDLDFQKIELTLNGKVSSIESFNTWNAAFDVTYNRGDLLEYFDVDKDAEVSYFKLRDLKLYYQGCPEIEADSVKANVFIKDSSGALSTLASFAGVDISAGNTIVVKDLGRMHEFKLAKYWGATSTLSLALNSLIQDPTKTLSFRLESEHYPNGSLVCGIFYIRLDMYMVYKECRGVPFGSKAGEPCG